MTGVQTCALPIYRECPFNVQRLLDTEGDDSFGGREATDVMRLPKDFSLTGHLQYVTGLKIDEQQAGPRVELQVAKRTEHAISRVVGEEQGRLVRDDDESRQAASMRYVDPLAPVTTPGELAGDEKRVGACYQHRVRLVQDLATANRSLLADRVDVEFQRRFACLNVLWSGWETLRDANFELVFAHVGNNAIRSDSVSGLEFQPQGTDDGALDERSIQGITVNRPRMHTQDIGTDRLQETRQSSQHGRPGPAARVRGANE